MAPLMERERPLFSGKRKSELFFNQNLMLQCGLVAKRVIF